MKELFWVRISIIDSIHSAWFWKVMQINYSFFGICFCQLVEISPTKRQTSNMSGQHASARLTFLLKVKNVMVCAQQSMSTVSGLTHKL